MINIQAIALTITTTVCAALILDKIRLNRKGKEEVENVVRKSKRCNPVKMAEDIGDIQNKMDHIEGHVNRSYDTENVMLVALHASLDGLSQLKCNGKVSEAKEELHKYLIERR